MTMLKYLFRSMRLLKVATHQNPVAKTMCCQAQNPQIYTEIINERSELAEGPYWDQGHQRLYWVDMRNMLINSYSPATKQLYQAKVVSDKKPLTLVIRVDNTADKFLVALKGSLALIQWDGNINATLNPVEFLDVEDPASGSRCNDGKVDPSHRLWVGTMGAQLVSNPNGNQFEKDKGKMFRISHDGTKTEMLANMQIPNGLEWSLDKKKFYLVDSLTSHVTEYQYNDQDGTISNPRIIYNLKQEGLIDKPNSLPDGMTIDETGMLWVSVYGTGKVIRIDPETEKKIYEIQLDNVLQPTSVCFGGKNLDILFVTSARVDWTTEYEKEYHKSGYLFMISNLNVKGAGPSRPVQLNDSIFNLCCSNKASTTSTKP